MDSSEVARRITREVTAWPGVTTGTSGRGELAFRVAGREIGHLHGNRAAHFGFPRELWSHLLREGRVSQHPLERPGLAARVITGEGDVPEVVDLLRLNYDRIVQRHGLSFGVVVPRQSAGQIVPESLT